MPRGMIAAGVLGATAVALGAYAAHGLEDQIAERGYDTPEVARRVENFATGARYQLTTAAALLAISLTAHRSRWLTAAAGLLVVGIAVFSGCLYALAFAGDGWRWLGAVVPLGGLTMIVGWGLIALTGVSSMTTPPTPSDDRPTDADRTQAELVRLEEVITHQQKLVNDLNEALTATRRDVDAAAPRLHALGQTVERLAESQQGAEDHPDERPPHY